MFPKGLPQDVCVISWPSALGTILRGLILMIKIAELRSLDWFQRTGKVTPNLVYALFIIVILIPDTCLNYLVKNRWIFNFFFSAKAVGAQWQVANKSQSSMGFEMSNYSGSTPVVLMDGSILALLRRLLNFRYPRP